MRARVFVKFFPAKSQIVRYGLERLALGRSSNFAATSVFAFLLSLDKAQQMVDLGH